jgi:outer membrane protein assembly factor BamB
MPTASPAASFIVGNGWRCAAAALAMGLAAGAQAQWTQGAFDGGKTNANTAEALLTQRNVGDLSIRWRHKHDRSVVNQVSQADGRLFACGDASGLAALAPATGEVLWSRPAPGMGDCSVPGLAGGAVYAAGSDVWSNTSTMFAYDQASGDLLWSQPLTPSDPNYSLVRSTVVDEDRVYIGMASTRVIALNRVDGTVAWEQVVNDRWSSMGGISASEGRIYATGWYYHVNQGVSTVVAHDAKTGAHLWTASLGEDGVRMPPVAVGGRVHLFTDTARIVTLDAATGQQLSSVQLAGDGFVDMAAHDHLVFAVTSGKYLHAVDTTTGKVLWSRKAGKGLRIQSENIVWANQQVYAVVSDASQAKSLLVVRASDGRTVASLPFADKPFGYPVLSVTDGRVVISSHGKLTAFGL